MQKTELTPRVKALIANGAVKVMTWSEYLAKKHRERVKQVNKDDSWKKGNYYLS